VKHDHVYLQHIREAIDRVLRYTHADRDAFMADTMTQDAVFRNIEVMGEAVKNLSAAYREAHVDVPWKSVTGMRDRLIHGYAGIKLDLVWTVVEQDIPALRVQIDALLQTFPPESFPESQP
jgi:uncharacterized protein with HEPN domain